jgi:hypothetical protein
MIQTKTRNCSIAAQRAAPANKKASHPELTSQRLLGERIVIISNGKYVGGNCKNFVVTFGRRRSTGVTSVVRLQSNFDLTAEVEAKAKKGASREGEYEAEIRTARVV